MSSNSRRASVRCSTSGERRLLKLKLSLEASRKEQTQPDFLIADWMILRVPLLAIKTSKPPSGNKTRFIITREETSMVTHSETRFEEKKEGRQLFRSAAIADLRPACNVWGTGSEMSRDFVKTGVFPSSSHSGVVLRAEAILSRKESFSSGSKDPERAGFNRRAPLTAPGSYWATPSRWNTSLA
jgi:hypothetical protein